MNDDCEGQRHRSVTDFLEILDKNCPKYNNYTDQIFNHYLDWIDNEDWDIDSLSTNIPNFKQRVEQFHSQK